MKKDTPPLDSGSSCCQAPAAPVTAGHRDQAARFKALGDETRLEILSLLRAAEDQTLCVCHIEGHFALSQPTISHHLKVLREAGFVSSERRGSWVFYRLERETLRILDNLGARLQS